MNVLNLTPHNVVVVLPTGGTTSFAPSGNTARVSTVQTVAGDVGGIPLFNTAFGDVVDLPAPLADTLLLVSAMVRTALPDRKDLVSPADLVRDDAGNVVGCRGFICN